MHTALNRHLIFAFCHDATNAVAATAARTVELYGPHVAFARHIVMIADQITQSHHFACRFTSGEPLSDGQASLQTYAISAGLTSPRSSSCWRWRVRNQRIVADRYTDHDSQFGNIPWSARNINSFEI